MIKFCLKVTEIAFDALGVSDFAEDGLIDLCAKFDGWYVAAYL